MDTKSHYQHPHIFFIIHKFKKISKWDEKYENNNYMKQISNYGPGGNAYYKKYYLF
tara:strand:- start:1146 stop:1313 length:168 start_codon:yes stop_codon:yes gene_type:complete